MPTNGPLIGFLFTLATAEGSRACGSDPLPATAPDLLVGLIPRVKHGGDLGGAPPVQPWTAGSRMSSSDMCER